MNRLLFTAALILSIIAGASGLHAQEFGSIIGAVTDSETGDPLAGANITIEGTSIGTATLQDGNFTLQSVPTGTYTLVCTYIGYTELDKIITVTSDYRSEVDFNLLPDVLQSQEVIVAREMLLGGTGKITGIPGSAHFIGQDQLGKHNNIDIHRVLKSIPGINIQEEDGYGLRPNIGMRGTGVERSQKISLMEDGVLIAPAPYSAPAAYYFPTVSRMESIEVRKGSSQIKYGPFTTGGALNLISTRIPVSLIGKLRLNGGGHGQNGIYAAAGNSYENFGFVTEYNQHKSSGFKNLDIGGNTGFEKEDYLIKLRLNTSRNARFYQSFTVKLSQTDEVSNETYLGLTDDDFTANPLRRYTASQKDVMNSKHQQVSATHLIMLNDKVDVTTTMYRNEFDRNWYKLDRVRATVDSSPSNIGAILSDPASYTQEYAIITGASSNNDNALELKANNRSYLSSGVQSIVGIQLGNRDNTLHQIELGARYHEDEVDRFQWVDLYRMNSSIMNLTEQGIPGTESNRFSNAEAFAYFAQYRVSRGKFTAVPGIRYETMKLDRTDFGKTDPERTGSSASYRENNISIWIPGIGLEYDVNTDISLFTGIHRGFSPPGSKDGTDPETSINYELGANISNKNLGTQIVFFYNNYDNLLGSDLAGAGGSGSGDLLNGGHVEVKGMEYSARYDLSALTSVQHYSFPVTVAYTFTDARFKNGFDSDYEPWGTVTTGDELPYLPRHQFSFSGGIASQMWQLDMTGKYNGKVRTVAGQGTIFAKQSVDSHFTLDANLEYTLTRNNRLYAGVKNAFDTVYIVSRRPAGVRPGLPRTFLIGLKTDF